WQSGCGDCPHKRSYDTVWVDKSKRNYLQKKQTFLGVKDMTLATPSYWLKGLVERSFLKEYPVQVVHNGVDLTKFMPLPSDLREQYGLQNKRIVLGVATPWSEKKGLQDFYRLATLLDESYQVVLVGLTEEQKKVAPKNVLALPATNSIEELAKWYSAADVFVNCTYEDTYPTVNIESQACGCPAITYRTGGSIESVPEAQIVAQGDVEGLAATIVKGGFTLLPKERLDKNTYYRQYLRLYAGENRNENIAN
ncbi:MAG: glycosyltransferase, partial [Clostridia bacterium]|nr:glycosyltransferase [Clostridia bacterium]